MTAIEKPKASLANLWRLFSSCLSISAFTFGGGYVIVPLQKRRFCDELAWLPEDEMLDLVAMAQSAPGPVAVNAAVLTGHHLFGSLGGSLALLGTVLPPLIILSTISFFYRYVIESHLIRSILKAMQATVAALIIDTVYDMASGLVKEREPFRLLLLAGAFLAAFVFDVNVIYVILACGLLGFLHGQFRRKVA